MHQKLIVVGGGAAGFFCAVNAARLYPQLHVTVVEKTGKLLSKVRVSGGGRCNVTHACFDVEEMAKRYPRGSRFLKKTLYRFCAADCIRWFDERGVKLKTESDGRMFPVTDDSQAIIRCLLDEANKYGVEIMMNAEVRALVRSEQGFEIHLSNNKQLTADFVCVACGGYPKAAMFDWLTALGHTIEPPVPSLFTFNMPGNSVTQLMGVSVERAQVKIAGSKLSAEGALLITHWGMSGPAILKLSAFGARELAEKQYHFTVVINWASHYSEQQLREGWQSMRAQYAAQKTGNRNPFALPNRLWLYLLRESGVDANMRWNELPSKQQNKLIGNLAAQPFEVKGKTTFKDEFVTCGGIKLNEIDPATMQSRIAPNLFFAGEILNVDGITGGYNFQHAWTSGWIAANSIAEKAV